VKIGFRQLLGCAMVLLALTGCAPVKIANSRAHIETSEASNTIRTLRADHRFSSVSVQSAARQLPGGHAGEPLSILALSGGGADGAFGAGALVGLTRSGLRPQFSVVTGVSVGALIAPYAFLGPEWDGALIDIYNRGRAEHLLQPRTLGAVFGSSMYRGGPLRELVDRYASDALIQAVAHEAATGRLLLVSTTEVDTGETVLWDLGAIALHGGDGARTLFRDVLVASASVPGMFPPVIIHVQGEEAAYDEAHVDGTIAAPFFVPLALAQPARDGVARSRSARVYIIVDGRLSEVPLPTRLRTRAILSRSVAAGLNHMLRTSLQLTATNAELRGANLQFSAIPVGYPYAATFDFGVERMRQLFRYGYECAKQDRLWISSQGAAEDGRIQGAVPSQSIACPADDELTGQFASFAHLSRNGSELSR
jgi:predicted acylesterase/phospholipase RssA